ncbi:hypothetical protein Ancab_002214 [Ancistrocladus abbreviatus]
MKGNCLKVRSDQTDLSWLQGSFTGVLKSSCLPVNIQEELWKSGLLDYSVRPLGVKLVLIKPLGDANLINLKTENKGKLAKWFESIRPWSKTDVATGRVVWVFLFMRGQRGFFKISGAAGGFSRHGCRYDRQESA